MSNANYTRVTDTSVSGLALLAALSPQEILGLNYQGVLGAGDFISGTGASGTSLSGSNLVEAATVGLTLNQLGQDITQSGVQLNLGGDTAANAAALLGLLQLDAIANSGAAGNARLLKFNVLGGPSAQALVASAQLVNGSTNTAANVQIISATGTAGSTAAPLGVFGWANAVNVSGSTAYTANVLAYSPSAGVIAFKVLSN